MRLIPAIDIMKGKVVRLVKGDINNVIVYSDYPLSIAKRFANYFDILHIIDLDAAFSQGNNKKIIREIADNVNVELEVGGGIRDKEYAEELLDYVDSIILGTLAYKDKDTLSYLLSKYGDDRIIVAIDNKGGKVMIDGWRNYAKVDIIDAIKEFRKLGVNKFLVTDIERDGTLLGINVELYKDIAQLGRIIASGGIASIRDIITLRSLGIYGVVLGKALYENKIDISSLRYVSKEDNTLPRC